MKALLISLMAAAAYAADTSPLVNHAAPSLTGKAWINAPEGAPLTIAGRHSKVTVVHFWTFACINCRHNLPSYDRWHQQFAARDVAIIGVHTPELEHEKRFANVAAETRKLGIKYPVLFDPDYTNWNRWKQQFWPTVYVIDKKGTVRGAWLGELNYGGQQGEAKMANLIEELLAQ
jgi:alkyl hydroperoxide reductase subunit AhpC